MQRIVVNIRKCGPGMRYWQARWTDSNGKRHSRGLGGNLTKQEATVHARKLEAELNACASASKGEKPPAISAWCDLVAERRGHRGEGTKELYLHTKKHLLRVFGEQRRIDQVGPPDVQDFLASMRAYRKPLGKKPLSEQTINNHCRRAHTIWQDAIEGERVGGKNPWRSAPRSTLPIDDQWRYVSVVEAEQMIAATTRPDVTILVALCRFAGLRRGEAVRLAWTDVNLDGRFLRVAHQGVRTSKKRERIVPMSPRLHEMLVAARAAADPTTERVANRHDSYNLGKYLHASAKRAGLEKWSHAWQVLRRSCLTDWCKAIPLADVAKIAGNSVAVVQKFYHQVRPEVMAIVSGVDARGVERQELLSIVGKLDASRLARLTRIARRLVVRNGMGLNRNGHRDGAGVDGGDVPAAPAAVYAT